MTPPLKARDERAAIPTAANVSMKLVDTSFNARMRSYMPEGHSTFLLHLARHSIRSFVERYDVPELTAAFSGCVLSLKKWRDAHIVIVTQFVICPARHADGSDKPRALEARSSEAKPVRGTGGTSLIPLLKIYRDNTSTRVEPLARSRIQV
jgi:indoleamine 2,3-dioxygenase